VIFKNISSGKNKLLTIFIEVGFIVPFVGVSKIIIIMHMFNMPQNSLAILLISLISLSIYLLDRIKINSEDRNSNIKKNRIKFIQKHKFILLIIALFCTFLFVSISYIKLDFIQLILINIPIFIFLIYNYLKKYLFLDTIGIALAWSSQLILLPLFLSNVNIGYTVIFLSFIAFFVMKVSESELSNIRDMKPDKKAGHTTLPLKYGSENVIIGIKIGELFSILIINILINNLIFFSFSVVLYLLFFLSIDISEPDKISRLIFKNRFIKIILAIIVLRV